MKKLILILLLLIFCLGGCLLFLSYDRFADGWYGYRSEADIHAIVAEIDGTHMDDLEYLELFEHFFPGARKRGLFTYFLLIAKADILGETCDDCYAACFLAANLYGYNDTWELDPYFMSLAFALNNGTEPERCFDYFIGVFRFQLDRLAEDYFCKPFSQLTHREKIAIGLRWKYPSRKYDENPEKLAADIREFLNKNQ